MTARREQSHSFYGEQQIRTGSCGWTKTAASDI